MEFFTPRTYQVSEKKHLTVFSPRGSRRHMNGTKACHTGGSVWHQNDPKPGYFFVSTKWRSGTLVPRQNGHSVNVMGFPMKLLSPTAKVTHFLFLSLFLSPLADTAALNSSQGSICINLIKMTEIIGVDTYAPPNHYSLSLLGLQLVMGVTGSVLILWGKCQLGDGKLLMVNQLSL